MKPAPFEYHAPTTIQEAVSLLAEKEDSKLIAGGQSLMPLLNMRLARPKHLVDLNTVGGLDYVTRENGTVRIGATVRQRTIERTPWIKETVPLLANAIPLIGHAAIRSRGTVCGSIAHADPASELPSVILALGGTIVAEGPDGEREIAPEDFFLTYLTTTLGESEIVKEVRFPVAPPRTGAAYLELVRRHGDYAIVGVGAQITLNEDGTVADCRIGLCNTAPTPLRPTEAEDMIKGERLTEELARAAGEKAMEITDPASDLHGSAEYRRAMTAVYVRRALMAALAKVPQA